MKNKETIVKVGTRADNELMIAILVEKTGMLTVTKNEAWRLHLALQSFFGKQPRNKRTGNKCPDCGKIIDDRATHCRNDRVRKGKGDEPETA